MEKLTPEYLESQIAGESYLQSWDTAAVPGTLTICILTMKNGLHIVGKSACLNPKDFNAELGKQIARKDAFEQLWQLEGYARASEALKTQNVTIKPRVTISLTPSVSDTDELARVINQRVKRASGRA